MGFESCTLVIKQKEITMFSLKRVFAPICTLLLMNALAGCAAVEETYEKCASAGCTADGKITKDVQANLRQHPEFGANRLHVQTIDSVVYLDGTVAVGELRSEAESVAVATPGVTRVVNNLSVAR
jgi:osmotically-inducible protein OsmY